MALPCGYPDSHWSEVSSSRFWMSVSVGANASGSLPLLLFFLCCCGLCLQDQILNSSTEERGCCCGDTKLLCVIRRDRAGTGSCGTALATFAGTALLWWESSSHFAYCAISATKVSPSPDFLSCPFLQVQVVTFHLFGKHIGALVNFSCRKMWYEGRNWGPSNSNVDSQLGPCAEELSKSGHFICAAKSFLHSLAMQIGLCLLLTYLGSGLSLCVCRQSWAERGCRPRWVL